MRKDTILFWLLVLPILCAQCKTAKTSESIVQDNYQQSTTMDRIASLESTANTIINASSFGFSPDAGAAQNTLALQRISDKINTMGGGVTLVIDNGIYSVGKETFARASKKGFAYSGESMLKIEKCTKPVIIVGNGATIRFADGLHFGSFNSITGSVHKAPAGGFYNYDYVAYPKNIFDFQNNKSVVIRNLILDGNIQKLVIGGYWGDTGIQLPGDGIFGFDNDEIVVENITSKHFPRDGIHIGNTTPNENAPTKKIFLLNSVFSGNARQGFSWIGGNHLYAVNCQFINSGKTMNNSLKAPLMSAPGAGVDMEAELGIIRNGVFENCLIDNNAGAGFLSVGDVASIKYIGGKIVGATNWSIYGTGPKAIFDKTTIVGSPVNLRVGSGPNDPDNARFNTCLITLDSTLSSTGKVYGNYVMDFGGGAGGYFENCTIDSKNRGTVYGGDGCIFKDCTFKQDNTAPGYNGYSFMRGNFYGTNRWIKPGPAVMPQSLRDARIYGSFYINGVEVTGRK